MNTIELKRFWEKVKEEYVSTLPESVHPWIYSLEVSGYDKGVLTVVTGQAMARDWLRKNHSAQMNNILKKISGNENAHINIFYDENEAKKMKKEVEKIHKKEMELQQKEKAMENLSFMQSSSNLNLKYKFENFVVGDNNKFAHAAAMAVAKNPAKKYNPLFIYGKAGLGKTHLMQAIGHYTIFNNPKLRVKYTTTDDYISDFISCSRKSNDYVENLSKFNKKYTNVDIILLDDIQFIESKGRTMERLQHTFNHLYDKGKQIVITSDRLPEEIPTLTDALSSRFKMGLMVELTPPEVETRLKILQNLADNCGIETERAALKYIAENFEKNVRELEGAFTKVCAYAEMAEQKITLSLAEQILKCKKQEAISFNKIAEVCAEFYNADLNDIKGTSRNQKIAGARQLIFYLCRELTNQSFESIGEFFDKKHTTVMYGYTQIKQKINSSPELSDAVREIKQALKVIQ